ncbi:MAG: hypothetical protein CMG00_07435 [Candidatus Marinimicrobia bacterium]|nr:hypothetical protein [Candidatus Neomarinimicrobiota bacterium]|tara:strand:- start:2001 stop:2576 length:576 start_codon:yes stop_codon:yes gene_type:complete
MELKNKYFLASLLFVVSCSYYSFKGSLPAHIDNVNILPIINNSTEYLVMEVLENEIYDTLLKENVLKLTSLNEAKSRLDITINSVDDKPYTFSSYDNVAYELVDEWRVTIKAKVSWYDLLEDKLIFSNEISSFGVYSATKSDISDDGIDNDGDGLTDSEDEDEFGLARDSAIKIASKKMSENIVANIIATW